MASSLLPAFLKRPKKPFFSSSSPKPFSSTTRSERDLPTSPRSLVRTEFSAFSEKLATFFWAAAPYWRIRLESVRSIFLENASTACFSASFSRFSSICTGVTSGLAGSGAGAAGATGSSVSWGTSSVWLGSRVSWGIMLFSSAIVCSSVYSSSQSFLSGALAAPESSRSCLRPLIQ